MAGKAERLPKKSDAGPRRALGLSEHQVSLRAPRLLVYLDAVARCGSIRKAAETVHIAPSALDRHILELESQLGTPLFERLARGVRPTAAGEIFLQYARRSLADLEATRSQIEHLQGLVRGDVHIASAESVGSNLLPQVIGDFQASHPGVRFHVTLGGTETLLQGLLNDQNELLLAHDPQHENLAVLAQVRQPLCALLRPDHPLARRASLKFSDCLRHPIALGSETFGSRRLIDQFVAAQSIKLNPLLVSNSVENLKAYTRRTGAISFQFKAGTVRDVALGELVAVPLVDPLLATGKLVLGVRRGRFLAIAAQTFAASLRQALLALP